MRAATHLAIRFAFACGTFLLLTAPTLAADSVPSFRREVMAVLARGGCNQGACHGNLNGKGGLKLSLRGEDPATDFVTLTREGLARRTDPLHPDQSLLILKTMGGVPHEGGVRFAPTTPEVAILRRWIAAGCPDDPVTLPALTSLTVTPREQILTDSIDSVQLSVTARFADGLTRDVTRLAVSELSQEGLVKVTPTGLVQRIQPGDVVVLVRYLEKQVPVRLSFLPERSPIALHAERLPSPIDQRVFARFEAMRLQPSAPSDDAMFLRRVTLDLTGRLPTANEATTFLADASPNKREKWVDRLLASDAFADYWAMRWSDILRNEEKALDSKGVRVFHAWIRAQLAADRPLTEFAAELVSGRGSTYESPAANLYRSLRDPMTRAESVAQLFLGVRLQCARCHNHPFDQWTQDEYHQFTAFFSQVQYRVLSNNRRDTLDTHEFVGEQIVYLDRTSEWPHPRTKNPTPPKFLGGPNWTAQPGEDRLQALAAWLRQPSNPFFAKAQVNRVWSALFGRGLVEPNDDFRLSNPASHPDVLEWLAADFAKHGHRLKPLIRTIVTSQTYQLSSLPNAVNANDDWYESHARPRPIAAEPLMDAVSQVLGVSPRFAGYPKSIRAVQVAAPRFPGRNKPLNSAERFLRVFGQPDRLLTCDCERSDDPGILQAFQFLSGEWLDEQLQRPDNRLGKLLEAGQDDRTILHTIMLSALSRRPSDIEERAILRQIAESTDRRKAWEDTVWGILNCKEFLLRR
ncbi:DUF1549 and DUF1553 domain-containing protein [Tuwongella immobilis]|uniref:BIG2 domain-containing protein n=1 Tax=Tuwongella immobilis TaxID=692036 RepID=A0A6C2YJF4_9BACT|nr:DUF1549 and DUF1553 domain-containing protein [Tuwongella immobilis]VIP01698.1 Uncharacterized protein OS=Pirellula staleyi (strain ATCC 27377 / DSM 6068 / ICPB 4128) GN=Psta_2354 PE=4 SV=1: PSCyt2: PSD1 [Tuwongella immobilis]VTR99182.1 Uncharacterized protein OS=Pirellula staleyi (strain ATCC 27377 / DSM 6068 / ICPB 4128) GN=Psta_2354 PE=4 SV=1: PSCyt2: PSD1 [Tuwongella immobilis]